MMPNAVYHNSQALSSVVTGPTFRLNEINLALFLVRTLNIGIWQCRVYICHMLLPILQALIYHYF